MSVQVENLEKSMAKLTIEVSAEQFEAAMQKAYIKNKQYGCAHAAACCNISIGNNWNGLKLSSL